MENEHNFADNRDAENVIEESDKRVNSVTSNSSDFTECFESGEDNKSQKLAGGFINEVYLFHDDVVVCHKYDGLVGEVVEMAGDAYSEVSIQGDGASEDDGERTGGTSIGGGDGGRGNGKDKDIDISDFLQDGQVRIRWTNGSETLENIDDVTLVDRSFRRGDTVASSSDRTGQLGLVLTVSIMVDLQAADGEVINCVSSKDLKRIREPHVGDYVVLGSCLGVVHNILDTVTVSFDCGIVYKFVKADPRWLQPLAALAKGAVSSYYPGQRVRICSTWLSGLWKVDYPEGTVISVQAGSVIVNWKESAYLDLGANLTQPSLEQDPNNLTMLPCYSDEDWKLGDWCHLPAHQSKSGSFTDIHMTSCMEESVEVIGGLDSVLGNHQAAEVPAADGTVGSSHETMSGDLDSNVVSGEVRNDCNETSLTTKYLESKFQSHSHDSPNPEKMNKDGNCGTVFSEGGSCSNSPSVSSEITPGTWHAYLEFIRGVFFRRNKKPHETSERSFLIINIVTKVDVLWQDGTRENGVESKFLYPNTPSDHQFFPGAYVAENASAEGDDSSEKRMGVVKSMSSKEHTVCVRWLNSLSKPEESPELDFDEFVSAYELSGHPDHDYLYGDVVVRLTPVLVSDATTDCGSSVQHRANLANVETNQVKKHSDDEAEQAAKDEVLEDFRRPSWVGTVTGFKDGDIEVTWVDGTVSKVGPHTVYNISAEDYGAVEEYHISWGLWLWNFLLQFRTGDLNFGTNDALPSLSVRGIISRLSATLFSRGKKLLDLSEAGHSAENNESGISEVLDSDEAHEELNFTDDWESSATSSSTAMGSTGVVNNNASFTFRQFDIAENPSDHYFAGSPQINGKIKWMKKVQQEWSILEKNLPHGIYVRVFEERMDILRAVIVGACGTPYQDGLFFFDFHLAPEYPQVPPSTNYHSGGLRINPNLYEDGTVCLSLLNTWTGRGNEVWDPSFSSILQVLVSIQGLVLNSKPYFNEPGHEMQIGTVTESNSLPYNENTYLLNLKSMLYLLRRPPMLFEDFVKDHFRKRGHYILKACEAYMEGCMIASLTEEACRTEESSVHPCSVGFKLMLAKLLPRLIAALTELGVDCEQFEHLQRSSKDLLPS